MSSGYEFTTNNQLQTLGQGGRYDQLLAVYHPQQKSAPGIGFSLNLGSLHRCLLSTDILPQKPNLIDYLVVAKNTESQIETLKYAKKLREDDNLLRVTIEIGKRNDKEIKKYAQEHGIKTIVWIEKGQEPIVK